MSLTLGLAVNTALNTPTVLRQTEGVTGLQVIKDGKCVAVDSLPNAFVINLGDQIQVLSNGRYKSQCAPQGSESIGQQNSAASVTGNVLWTQRGHCEWSN